MNFDVIQRISKKTDSKIVYLVIDGVGDIHTPEQPETPLELANTPNLDAIAKESVCGRSIPVSYGITPGSGPGHLGIFGYESLNPAYDIGRGVLEVLGIDFDLQPDDVAARGNFAEVDKHGVIVNRRAGRLPTEKCVALCEKLQKAVSQIDDVEIIVRPVKEYRFAVVLRGKGLSGALTDTDPQQVGLTPKAPEITEDTKEARRTLDIVNKMLEKFYALMKNEKDANSFLLRGFSKDPCMSKMQELYHLNPAAIATYPLYRGVARLIGMDVLKTGTEIADEFETLSQNWNNYDYFFIHIKKTDSSGEDGNLEGKVKVLEELDVHVAQLRELNPDVIVVTGDHSTPCPMQSHSWHPVPFMLKGKFCDPDSVEAFNETACDSGRLGLFRAVEIMEIALANAGKLDKYGA